MTEPFDLLYEDALIEILQHLDAKSLGLSSTTNRDISQILDSPSFWKRKVYRDYPHDTNPPVGTAWKDWYKTVTLADRDLKLEFPYVSYKKLEETLGIVATLDKLSRNYDNVVGELFDWDVDEAIRRSGDGLVLTKSSLPLELRAVGEHLYPYEDLYIVLTFTSNGPFYLVSETGKKDVEVRSSQIREYLEELLSKNYLYSSEALEEYPDNEDEDWNRFFPALLTGLQEGLLKINTEDQTLTLPAHYLLYLYNQNPNLIGDYVVGDLVQEQPIWIQQQQDLSIVALNGPPEGAEFTIFEIDGVTYHIV